MIFLVSPILSPLLCVFKLQMGRPKYDARGPFDRHAVCISVGSTKNKYGPPIYLIIRFHATLKLFPTRLIRYDRIRLDYV